MRAILFFFIFWLSVTSPVQAQTVTWEEQDNYVNGFARVIHQSLFTFIDTNEKIIAPFVFEDARNFHNHVAAVMNKDRWGFINEQGTTVIPIIYDIAFDFTEIVSVASISGRWWLINLKGKRLKELDISVCHGFQNGKAIVSKDGLNGTLYTDGRIEFEKPAPPVTERTIPYSPSNVMSVCPPNLNFENGNFTNWACFTGRVDSVGTTNVITVTPSPPTPGRHTIITRATPSAIDPYGLFPTNPPDGSMYAVKLGNTSVGAQAERIRYVIHVPQNDSNFSFKYHYAVVLQDPGHTPWTQPRFNAKLFDSTANVYIPCASFEYVSTSGLPGFAVSTVNSTVIYKPWSSVFISLRGYAGKTIYLEFTTADCVRTAHWGYGYVDVENTCGQNIQFQYNCNLPHIATLTGPPGFQYYNWWNQNFTTLLGTGQTITLNPGPPPNSLVWLEMVPFVNFGCKDTLPVRLTGTVTPSFGATDTLGICAPHNFTFYNHNIPDSIATWNFGDGGTATGDTVTHTYSTPGTYIVTMTAIMQSGCSGVATDTVRVVQPTGSYSYTGGSFCGNHTVQFTATTSYIDSLFWDFGDGTFLNTTLTTVSHTYTQPGIYVPHLVLKSIHGCQLSLPGPDTIRIEKLVPGYSYNIQNFCGYTTVSFTDTSNSFFGLATHTWNFGDGGAATGINVSHTYTVQGSYNVKLVITGVFGCRDSIIKNIVVTVHNFPVSAISGPLSACAGSTLSYTGSVVSADAVSAMNWTCTNGATGTGNTFDVTFGSPGTFYITLSSVTQFGCSDTISHVVVINPLPTASISGPATVCLNTPSPLVTFTGAGGTAPYTFTYSINGGANQTVTTTSGNSVTISAPTNIAGTFNYTLISVQDGSSTACTQLQSGTVNVIVNPLPTASINGPATVCLNAPSPLITFTGAGGTAPYTFTYSINGGANQTVTTTSGNSVTISAPTNVAGTFNYTLISVQEGSASACTQLQSGTVNVIVNPLPTASISGPATVCLNAPSPLITFTGAGGTAPYTFTYSINGGANQTVTTTSGSSVTIVAPTNITGTFNYTLISVRDASSTACTQLQSGTVSVIVNPLPTASISGPATVCLNAPSPLITFTGAGGTVPYTFTYSINGGANQMVTTTSGSSVTIAAPTNIAGTFNYTLISVRDASSTACTQLQSGTVSVIVNPLPTASISGPAAVCLNAPSPLVTFTGAGGTAPYTFTYSINGGANQTVTTTSGNSVAIAAPTNVAGTFNYTLISVRDASSTACTQLQSGTVSVIVNPLPTASISGPATVCLNAPSPLITFTGAGGTAPYTFTYSINGGANQTVTTTSGNSVTIAAPTNISGTFTYSLISVQDGSATACMQLQSGTVSVIVNPLPTASISGPATVCLNAPSPLITFTGAGGTAPYTFTYSINGGANQTVTTTSGSSVTIAAPTNIAGTFNYTLISVRDASSTACTQLQSGTVSVIVNPLPTASISGPATVCLNAPSPLITFTGAGGTAPYTFTYSINGGANQTVTTTSGNSVTIAAPTNISGTFTYSLISVQDGSATACMQLQSGTVSVIVNPLPMASISGPATVCLNAPSPLITFTGAGGTAPYTFTYSINGGANQTVTTTSGSSVTIAAPTNIAGTFNYTLISVRDASSTACTQLQSGTVSVIVNPLPTASISGPATVCLNAPSPLITFTGAGGTVPYTFTYSINGGANQTVTTTSGNSVTISIPTNIAGTFNYTLISVQDGSATACTQLQSGTVSIIVNPLPTANINSPATAVCLNASSPPVTFSASGGTAPYTFTYSINGGPNQTVTTTSGNSVTVLAPTNIAGTFNYTLISVQDGSSTACTQLQSGTVSVIVNPLPTASISGPAAVCINGVPPPITFTGGSSTAPYTITYSINGGANQTVTTASGNSVTITAPTNVAGTFTYSLISVRDGSSNACSQAQTGSAVITINPLPNVLAGADKNLCLGRSVQLQASGAAQYTWSPPAGLSCTNCPAPAAGPSDTTRYIVTGTSSFGCVNTDTVYVNVIKPFPMTASPDDTICVGRSVVMHANGANTYLWSPSAGLNRTDIASPTASPLSTTTYRVIGRDGYNCFSDTAYIKIFVGPVPVVDAGGALHLSPGDVVTLNPTVQNGPIINWLWEPATDLSCSNCPNPRLTVHDNMTYTVTVTNDYHCVARDVITINTFCKSSQVFIPNAFTPDGDGLNDILMVRGKGIHVNYFRLFSRWGELVFERRDFAPNDPRFGWDGRIRGIPASPDVFVYTAEVVCDNNVLYTVKGNTTLLK